MKKKKKRIEKKEPNFFESLLKKKKEKKKLIQENLNAKVKIHNSHAKFIPVNRKKWRERNKKMQTYLDSIQIKGIKEDGEDSARVGKFF